MPSAWLGGRLAAGSRSRLILAYAVGAAMFFALLQLVFPVPFGVIVQGIIIGALTALIAFGIALIYRSNRIINFAQADLGIIPATLTALLIAGTGLSYWLAVPIGLATAVGMGALAYYGLIRFFSKAPRLIVMVVTIGISTTLAGFASAMPAWFNQVSAPTQIAVPFGLSFSIGTIVFRSDDVIAIGVAGAMIAGLFALLRRTNIGIALRASAESADRAAVAGINVDGTHAAVWIIASVMSAMGVILRAGILGLPQGQAGPEILVRALAAAVIGKMENFGLIFAAACGLEIVESAILWNKGSTTLVDPAIFVLVVVALLAQRRRPESRVEAERVSSWSAAANVRGTPRELVSLPEVKWLRRGAAALLVVGVAVLPYGLSLAHTNLAGAVLIYAIIALSLVVLTGWAGEISLGQIGFVAIGAATAATLNVHDHWDLILTTLVAGVVGAVAALVVGLPALRIRGIMLAVTTLAFAVATSDFLLDKDYFHFLPADTTVVNRLPVFGRLNVSGERAFYYVCLVALFFAFLAVWGLRRSRLYRVLVATRDNERTALAMGINVTRARLTAFAVSGFLAAGAGGLLAVQQQALGTEVFAPTQSLLILTMVVVGGLGSMGGAVVGAVFISAAQWFNTSVPVHFRTFFTQAVNGAGLLGILIALPGGLGSLGYSARDWYLRVVADRRGILVPSLFADAADVDTVKDRRPSGHPGHRPASDSVDRGERPPAFLRMRSRRSPPMVDYFSFPDPLEASPALLSVRSINVAYGQVQVLFGVSLEVADGDVLALLGTNGAGKSTVLRAVSGLSPPTSGTVSFQGRDITRMAAHRIAALGITQVPGGRGVFPSLTVAENLRMGAWLHRRDHDYVRSATAEVLGLFPQLQQRLHSPAATLSGGQQQMLTLALAFLAKPRLLMIDELSLGLAPTVVDHLLDVVRRFREDGITLVLVEQSVNVALTVADRAYFMEKGAVRFHGRTADLLARPDVLRSVFLEGVGPHPGQPGQPGAAHRGTIGPPDEASPVALEVIELSKRFSGIVAVEGVSLELRRREILALIGPNGAGKTTVFDLTSGFLSADRGRIVLNGRDITDARPEVRAQLGLSRSFQDARLFSGLTVHQCICVALDREVREITTLAAALNLPWVRSAERRLGRHADELVDLMGLQAYRDKFVSELSTGSRRIVDLACQIAVEPEVILLDEPSSGIAQRESEALGPLLRRVNELTSASVLLIEHDMALVTGVADRIVALDLGRVVAEGTVETVLSDPGVIASYLGTSGEAVRRSGPRGAIPEGVA